MNQPLMRPQSGMSDLKENIPTYNVYYNDDQQKQHQISLSISKERFDVYDLIQKSSQEFQLDSQNNTYLLQLYPANRKGLPKNDFPSIKFQLGFNTQARITQTGFQSFVLVKQKLLLQNPQTPLETQISHKNKNFLQKCLCKCFK